MSPPSRHDSGLLRRQECCLREGLIVSCRLYGATHRLAGRLSAYGVKDPDEEWGRYVLLRSWDEPKFLASLRVAESTPRARLNPDGNRALERSVALIRQDPTNKTEELLKSIQLNPNFGSTTGDFSIWVKFKDEKSAAGP